MLNFESRSYAHALLDLIREKNRLEDGLEAAREVLASFTKNSLVFRVFNSAFVSKLEKQNLFVKLFPNLLSEFYSLFNILVKRNLCFKLPAILREFITFVLAELSIIEGVVYSTLPLADSEFALITESVSQQLNKKVVLSNKIDKNLLAGVKIEVDNHVIELSFASLLEQAKKVFLEKRRERRRKRWL